MAVVPVGEVPEAVHAIARPVYGENELDEIVELVAHKRLVLLGEASHGTHDFYDLRASITRKLISDHGFAAVAIEGDWPDALRVDRYVRDQVTDDESAAASLEGFERFPRWMWRNEDVERFVTWLRQRNAELPAEQRCGFYGLDLYSLHASMHAVLQYLADNDRDAAQRARERYRCFDHVAGDPQSYGMQAHLGIGPKCEAEVVAQLAEMQRRKIARSGRSPAGDAWFHAMQQAHVVRNAEAYYRAMFGGRSASWNLRDTHMADTVDLLAEHLGRDGAPAKLVIWAHNSHVGDARATEMGEDGQVTLGQILRQRHPNETALVGMTCHRGHVIAAYDWEEAAERERVRPALPGSWEELFHDTELPRFYVTAAQLRRVVGDHVDRLQRAIGVVYRPETERRSHYLHARLADEFDVIIHVDDTRALEPLDRLEEPAPAPAEPEVPETYPTGV
jgi:erythromycin esterase-like protein